ncbi:TolC family outer membrane protein [Oxalicibacterium solurbis]|uniref:Outer membrane protein n=1 Tax=Oxalicibacterium solurbis TaxID=69280 RepID=A0A8J3AYY3_9BURK|nr:TolC family outer membrane protein [Oxalicibacterium solurbis]GGI54066.1 outer membrane protein [Oxalicibacterium solurbis]
MHLARSVTLIAGLLLSPFFHANAHAADLLQVYQDALVNDAVYASARAQLAADQELSVQGRANLLPLVGLSGTRERIRRDDTPNVTSNSYALSLSQPLFDPAAWQNYEQSKLAVTAGEAAFSVVQQDLILRTAQAYFDVLTAQDALASLEAEKTAIAEQLESAKRQFEVGSATITDTHEAQARFDLATAQEFAARNTLDVTRAALQQIIGKAPDELATLRTGIDLQKPQPVQMDQWVHRAEQQNFDVVSRQLALEIAMREITRNRSGHYPTVDLVASRSNTRRRNDVLGRDDNGPETSVGVQWSIPLFSGFSVTSRVRQAIALEDKARADLETSRRAAAQSARQAYFGVTNGLAQVKALEAAERSSKSALDSNLLGYQVGVRINIDVLNAQQQLYATQRDLAKARYDTLMNSLRLKAAAGTLREEDLVRINTLLTAR